jgi:Domain of unknown function (DUF4126)
VDAVNWLEIVPSLALGIGLAACAGLRAWLPLLLLGSLARWGVVDLGPSFEFVASTRALILFGVATVIEIAGDKIPAVDHTLDALSTVLRPAAGSLLAASVLWQISDPLTAMALGIAVGAPSALVPHAAKSTLRVVSTTFTGGLANPVLSFVEDAAAFVLFVVTVVVPVLAASLVVLTGFLVARRLLRRSPPTARPAPAP